MPVGDDKHDRFRQIKDEFIQNIEYQKTLHPVIKSIACEIKDLADRSAPFDYEKFVGLVDEQIRDIRTKVSPGF